MAYGKRAKTIRSWCKTRASHTTHKHSFTGGRLGVIPSKRAFSGWNEFVEGSSGTRAVVEVVVLATVEEVDVHGSSWEVVVHVVTVVEVVVHGDGSRTRSFRRCPGSSVEEVVVHGRRCTWRSEGVLVLASSWK